MCRVFLCLPITPAVAYFLTIQVSSLLFLYLHTDKFQASQVTT